VWLTESGVKPPHSKAPKAFGAKRFVSIRVHSWLALKYGNEMAQFVFYVARDGYSLRNLVTQQLPVSLTQAMERLLHRVFRHSNLGRHFCL
jgi:hypothetical protein